MRVSQVLHVLCALTLPLAAISCTQNPSPATPSHGAAPAAAPTAINVAGTWTWSVDAGGNTVTHTAVLKQTGETLTGTFTDSYDNTTVNIKEGKIHDGQVTLTVVRPFMDNGDMTMHFTGKIQGNTITGKLEFTIGDQPTDADWNAKRTS